MSIYEYDKEREMKLIRADEREIGRSEGIAEILRNMLAGGIAVEQVAQLVKMKVEEVEALIKS